ncbi:MAG: aminotransferase class I/II-fold pyridoxal phosphate-dependent enzyme [Geovibrio sp.]|nr:aminotransferase class I/II-fold pyridoxal phosphate-dependent enzyme [Geovibrio sp.]
MYLTSPGNPTGNLLDEADMLAILKATQDRAMVVVDETYIEFTKRPSLTTRLKEFPHLVILRTLSKSYSLAGLRMGCLISGDTDLVTLIRTKVLETYPLPVASVQAALKICEPDMQKLAAENRQKLLAERARLAEVFSQSPAVTKVYPSDANFLLIEMKDARGFYDLCWQNKIVLRDFSTAPGTENCLRISIGLPEENDKLISLLGQFSA